jgi:hypothetical protein
MGDDGFNHPKEDGIVAKGSRMVAHRTRLVTVLDSQQFRCKNSKLSIIAKP